MPLSTAIALIAAASMAGLPGTFGFIGKESLYAVVLAPAGLTILTVCASAFFLLVAFQTGVRPFWSRNQETPRHPHEAPWTMLVGPALLAALTLAAGIAPGFFMDDLVGAAVRSIVGIPVDPHLHVWHGFNTELLLTGITLLAGASVIIASRRWVTLGQRLSPLAAAGPDRLYDRALVALMAAASWQTRALQSGSLRRYLLIIVLTLCTLFVLTFVRAEMTLSLHDLTPVSAPLAMLSGLIILAALAATMSASRLGAVAAMGVVGFSVALLFIYFGAPDLAMTQLVVETLSVVLLVSAFYFLPPFTRRSTWRGRARDLTVAIFAGIVVTLLVLVATGVQLKDPISSYYAETSVPVAHGRNIVNVILVDYRGLDTLGEITVLAVAGIGALALLRLRGKPGGSSS